MLEEGAPRLEAGSEDGGVAEGLPLAPEAAADGLSAVPGWTPAAAARFVCAIWNVGAIVYGKAWIARPTETADFSYQAAALLEQFLPVGAGGPMELIVNATVVAGGLVEMGMKREEVIAAGPRWTHNREPGRIIQGPWPPAGPGQSGAVAGGPPPAAAPPEPSPAAGGGDYALPPELAVLTQPFQAAPTLGGMGYPI